MSSLGFPEILLLVVIVVVLFGAKRLPDAARSLGRSMRIFKSEVKEMSNDDHPAPLNGGPQPQATGDYYQPPQQGQQYMPPAAPHTGSTHPNQNP